MQGDSFYTNFSAYVQAAVVFGFGLLYLYKNNRSIFKSIQSDVFDAFRKNALFKWLFRYPTYVTNKVTVRKNGTFLNSWKGLLSTSKAVFEAALDMERTCDYLAVLGIVSGFYSMGWLLLVPWTFKYGIQIEDMYMTLTVSTVVADVLMVIYVLANHITRSKLFIFSTIVLSLSCLVGLTLYNHGLYVESFLPFDDFFLASMIVPYSSVCFFIIQLLAFAIFRLIVLALTLILSILLHTVIKVRNLMRYLHILPV